MPDISFLNKKNFNEDEVVAYYSRLYQLQRPEKVVLDSIRDKLADMRMLDIGVGGGRTSVHFANFVKEYVGIDYSDKMIEACKTRFLNSGSNISFRICDVRKMSDFSNGYFDFVLYSFNGIDCMSHEDRLAALREIKRVCKRGGLFCFSAHNLNTFLHIIISANIVKIVERLFRYLTLRRIIRDNKHAIICDKDIGFNIPLYYIKPDEQVRQLQDMGFRDIRILDLGPGREIQYGSLDRARDHWLYYLCNV